MEPADIRRLAEHTRRVSKSMFDAFDRLRPTLAECARQCYPPALPGLERRIDAEGVTTRVEATEDDWSAILDPLPVEALRKGASGFCTNLTPAARQWFRLAPPKDAADAAVDEGVKSYLDRETELVAAVMRANGTYRQLPLVYTHLLAFGFAAVLMLPDDRYLVRPVCLRPGTYALDTDERGLVCRLVRRFTMSGQQLVAEFGMNGMLPERVIDAVRSGRDADRLFTVTNLVEPHRTPEDGLAVDDLTERMDLDRAFTYRSVYLVDTENGTENGGIVRVAGYYDSPIIAPRISHENGDIYGVSRAAEAVKLMRNYQTAVYDAQRMAQNAAEPPVITSADFVDGSINLGRGGINIAGAGEKGESFITPVFQGSESAIKTAEYTITKSSDSIRRTFMNDVFSTLLTMADTRAMTATEVHQRRTEAMQDVATILTTLDFELLDRLVTVTAKYVEGMVDADGEPVLGDRPDDLASQIEYVSAVHIAQRASELRSYDKALEVVGSVRQTAQGAAMFDPANNIDFDAFLKDYLERLGIPSEDMAKAEAVAAFRARQRREIDDAKRDAQMAQMGKTARDIGGVPLDNTVAGLLARNGDIQNGGVER